MSKENNNSIWSQFVDSVKKKADLIWNGTPEERIRRDININIINAIERLEENKYFENKKIEKIKEELNSIVENLYKDGFVYDKNDHIVIKLDSFKFKVKELNDKSVSNIFDMISHKLNFEKFNDFSSYAEFVGSRCETISDFKRYFPLEKLAADQSTKEIREGASALFEALSKNDKISQESKDKFISDTSSNYDETKKKAFNNEKKMFDSKKELKTTLLNEIIQPKKPVDQKKVEEAKASVEEPSGLGNKAKFAITVAVGLAVVSGAAGLAFAFGLAPVFIALTAAIAAVVFAAVAVGVTMYVNRVNAKDAAEPVKAEEVTKAAEPEVAQPVKQAEVTSHRAKLDVPPTPARNAAAAVSI